MIRRILTAMVLSAAALAGLASTASTANAATGSSPSYWYSASKDGCTVWVSDVYTTHWKVEVDLRCSSTRSVHPMYALIMCDKAYDVDPTIAGNSATFTASAGVTYYLRAEAWSIPGYCRDTYGRAEVWVGSWSYPLTLNGPRN